jgi:hypothetical protein
LLENLAVSIMRLIEAYSKASAKGPSMDETNPEPKSEDFGMTPTQQKHVSDWIQSKCPTMQCPACRSFGFSFGPVSGLVLLKGANIHLGPSVPIATVVCSNCGYIMTFSAGVMGLNLSPPDKQ